MISYIENQIYNYFAISEKKNGTSTVADGVKWSIKILKTGVSADKNTR